MVSKPADNLCIFFSTNERAKPTINWSDWQILSTAWHIWYILHRALSSSKNYIKKKTWLFELITKSANMVVYFAPNQ